MVSVCAVMLVWALCGCGSAAGAPTEVAVGFHRAVSSGEGAAACRLLAPETVLEVEQAEQARCETAILRADVPAVDAVREVNRYGGKAQVRFDDDTVFLAGFPHGWRVVAAGCTPRAPRPYDCVVKN